MFISEKQVQTRKEHRCWGCDRIIRPHNPAVRYTGKEDEIYTIYYHPDCRAAEIELNQDWAADEWYPVRSAEREELEWLYAHYPCVFWRLAPA